jgi:hypothetical protein
MIPASLEGLAEALAATSSPSSVLRADVCFLQLAFSFFFPESEPLSRYPHHFRTTSPILNTNSQHQSSTPILNMSDPIADAAQKHPAPEGLVYTYGTAGVSKASYHLHICAN